MKMQDYSYCHPLPGFPGAIMALQPIVDIADGYKLFACEALVRGVNGEDATQVFESVSAQDLIQFDAVCRSAAITLAQFLMMKGRLSFSIPASVIRDARFGIQSTLKTARDVDWPANRLIMKITETEPIGEPATLKRWITAARNRGVALAVDDFGAGNSSLDRVLALQPDFLKLDIGLIRNIDQDLTRQGLVRGIVETCATFKCRVIAAGIETVAERDMLATLGASLQQGYLFAMPGSTATPEISRPRQSPKTEAVPAPVVDPGRGRVH